MKFIVCATILSVGLFKLTNAACAGPYAQCGGANFSGEACCQSSYKCVKMNDWYSQCQEDNSAASAPAATSAAVSNQQEQVPQSSAVNDNNPWGGNNNPWGGNNNPWGGNNNPWGGNNNNNNNPWGGNSNNNNNPWGGNNNPWGGNNNPWGGNNNNNNNPWGGSMNLWGGNNNNNNNNNNQNQNQNQNQDSNSNNNNVNNNNNNSNQNQNQNSSTNPEPNSNPNPSSNPWGNNNSNNQNQNQNQGNGNQIASGNGSSQNFFQNEIYANPKFIEEVNSSISKLNGDLKAKAEKVKSVPTAVWLSYEGATGEVGQHLKAAGSKTVVFILYMIPTRDCNSNASAGGSSSLETYKGYVNNISNTISQYPNSKVVMVVEPDTLGNLVTGNSESCKNVHTLHKNAISYAVDVFGSMSNVSVYLDAAHGKWLGDSTDKVAAVVKEILSNAPKGKIRGLSTNVSNYQSVASEYQYHQKLASSLSAVGIPNMKFIVDTGRNGVPVNSGTWCNLVGTGFGERPKGNPNPSMPLLDAYMWLKTPGEADGSATGSRADPVCASSDSLQGAPDAGQWFHDYFAQLLKNAQPGF